MTKHDQCIFSHNDPGRTSWRRVLMGVGVAGLAVALSACGGKESSTATSHPQATASPAAAISVLDPWVKVPEAGKKMTAAFAVLHNNTDAEVTVVSATSPVSPTMELHEMTMDNGKVAMRAKEGGFIIPAKGSHELKPGSDHLMLMDVQPIKAGDRVNFTLTLKDKNGKTQTLPFTAVAKPFSGAKETYSPGDHASTQSPASHG